MTCRPALRRMPERSRHCADDCEPEPLIKPDGRRIGGGDGVEVDAAESAGAGPLEQILAQRSADTSTTRIWRNLEVATCDVRTRSWPIGIHVRGAEHDVIGNRHDHVTRRWHDPHLTRLRLCLMWVVAEGVRLAHDVFDDRPDFRPVAFFVRPDLHSARVKGLVAGGVDAVAGMTDPQHSLRGR